MAFSIRFSMTSRRYEQSRTMILTQVLIFSACLVIVTMTSSAAAVADDMQTRRHPVSSTVSSLIVDRTKPLPRSRQQKKQKADNGQRLTSSDDQLQSNETGRYPLRAAAYDTIQTKSGRFVTKVADGWSSVTTVLTTAANIVDTTTATAPEKTRLLSP